MKRLLLMLVFMLASTGILFAQASPSPIWAYNWPYATATGVVGNSYISLGSGQYGYPSFYTIDVYVTGTLPSTCTFEVQSSPDGVVWNTGSASLSGDQTCSSSTVLTYSFFAKPARFMRINVGTLSGGDGTTKVYFFYTRGRDGNNIN
jgi:hypothetical protein